MIEYNLYCTYKKDEVSEDKCIISFDWFIKYWKRILKYSSICYTSYLIPVNLVLLDILVNLLLDLLDLLLYLHDLLVVI
jgi:hypothetical protein